MPKFIAQCPHCGQKANASDEWLGKKTKCPACGNVFTIQKPIELTPVVQPQPEYCSTADEETAEPKRNNAKLFLFGGIGIVVLAVCGAILFFVNRQSPQSSSPPSDPIAKTLSAEEQCQHNLKQIGLAIAMFSADKENKYPPNFNVLQKGEYLTNAKYLFCADGEVAYQYCVEGNYAVASNDIVAYCPKHGNVLFGDKHVDKMELDKIKNIVEKKRLAEWKNIKIDMTSYQTAKETFNKAYFALSDDEFLEFYTVAEAIEPQLLKNRTFAQCLEYWHNQTLLDRVNIIKKTYPEEFAKALAIGKVYLRAQQYAVLKKNFNATVLNTWEQANLRGWENDKTIIFKSENKTANERRDTNEHYRSDIPNACKEHWNAAQKGDAEAQFLLGMSYISAAKNSSLNSRLDPKEQNYILNGLAWIEKSARQRLANYPQPCEWLIDWYRENCEDYGIKKDYAKENYWQNFRNSVSAWK